MATPRSYASIIAALILEEINTLLPEADAPPTPATTSSTTPVPGSEQAEAPPPATAAPDTTGATPPPAGDAGASAGSAPPTEGGEGAAPPSEDGKEKPGGEEEAEPEDPVTSVVDAATKATESTRDVPTVLKLVKAGLENKELTRDQAMDVLNQISTKTDNPTLQGVATRLQQFITLQEQRRKRNHMTETPAPKKKMVIRESDIRKLASKIIERRLRAIQENATLSAKRTLMLKAQQHAMDFEKTLMAELGLMHYDEMDPVSAKIYLDAMEKMKTAVIGAVAAAINDIEGLPKELEKGAAPTATAP